MNAKVIKKTKKTMALKIMCFQNDLSSKARYLFTAYSEHKRLVSLRIIANNTVQPEILVSETYSIPFEFCFEHSRITAAMTTVRKLLNINSSNYVSYNNNTQKLVRLSPNTL